MGDRACWLGEVCDGCGRLIDAPDAHATGCPVADAQERTSVGGPDEVAGGVTDDT